MIRRAILSLAAMALMAMGCGPKDNPDDETPQQELTAPQGVQLTGAEETSLSFSWSAVGGAESYSWRLTKDHASVADGVTKALSETIGGLQKNTAYSFVVRALAGDKASSWSKAVDASTVDGSAPVTPAGRVQCVDAPVIIDFDTAPTLGSSGYIKVFKSSGGAEVDRINMADIATVEILENGVMIPREKINNGTNITTFMDFLPGGGRYRTVHYTPVRIKGKSLEIKLHSGVLEFGTEYYMTVDEGVVPGFAGIEPNVFKFSTSAAPASDKSLRVAADGSGDFCTIQGALSYANKSGAEITVATGTYEELLYLRDKSGISVKGDSRAGVRIAYPNNESYEGGSGGGTSSKPSVGTALATSGGRNLWLVENCDNFSLENLTIENTFFVSDHKGQAECIYFNSGSNAHKMTIENCSLISWQDTFLTKGVVWVHNSLIAGHVDFIWGYPAACLFEDCEIRARAGGYIIQARVPSASAVGFVFLNCKLTAEDGVSAGSMYLARSAGQSDCFDNVVYVNCKMSPAINSGGWYTNPAPNPPAPTATSGWREYGSTDLDGKPLSGHNSSGKVLSAEEAAAYSSREAVLGF